MIISLHLVRSKSIDSNYNQFGKKEAEIALKSLIEVSGLELPKFKVDSVEVGVNLRSIFQWIYRLTLGYTDTKTDTKKVRPQF